MQQKHGQLARTENVPWRNPSAMVGIWKGSYMDSVSHLEGMI